MPCFYFLRFFNARGPGPLSSGPADGRKQPRFTRNVSAAGVVQAPRPYSVSSADGRSPHSGDGKLGALFAAGKPLLALERAFVRPFQPFPMLGALRSTVGRFSR